ncbi:unnamed protein product [Miscanthus lutarioriparius]|uniref:SWIM-type domain-containing protein n=1 Tax=Miscanthus lutarioriparius TaxID=422564 RepID=A0A811NQL6_9POAL|nr:unnamed protein product [Miscanthus lutarioriparius]
MEESDITQAMRTSSSRSGEPVFLPAVGMEFDSAKEAKDFCNLYSWEIGFGIRKGRNRVNDNNYTTRQDFVRSCEGLCPNSRAATCRTGCKAMIRLHRTSDHGWVISRLHLQHNHPCSATHGQNKQWLSHSDIGPMTKDVVQKLRENNIPIGRVCSILGVDGTQSTIPIRKEAVRSLCARIAQDNIKDDIGKTLGLLEQMKRNDVGMEISFKIDEDGKIKLMLWCTGKNRADYAKFGDVSIVFGGVLLTTEKVEDFEWAFSKFVEIMGGKEPHTILTDQCQEMAAAIKTTLKATNHRWCRWHVLRKTKQKVGPTYSKKINFKKEFNKLVTEETMVLRCVCRKCRVGVPIERHAELIYTRRIYEKFYNELYYAGGYAIKSRTSDGVFEVAHSLFDGNADQIFYKVVYVGGEKITCQCGLYEHLGLLCRHSLKVLVYLDVKEIPKNNIMPRWMKDGDESADHSNVKTGFDVIRGSSDVLKKRALVNRVLEVAYGPNTISEEVYAQAMGVMDLVRSQSSMLQPLVDQPFHDPRISAVTSASAIGAPTNIRCPDRPTKKGRPANSSLQSWKEE